MLTRPSPILQNNPKPVRYGEEVGEKPITSLSVPPSRFIKKDGAKKEGGSTKSAGGVIGNVRLYRSGAMNVLVVAAIFYAGSLIPPSSWIPGFSAFNFASFSPVELSVEKAPLGGKGGATSRPSMNLAT